jgi:AraC-like DNA-binding protein
MSDGLRFESLHAAGDLRVLSCTCRPGTTARAGEECNFENSIVFVRRGAFVKHAPSGRVTADASSVVFFRRGEPYSVSHLDTHGDDCTILRIADADLLDAARAHDESAEDVSCPVRFTHAPTEPETDLLHRRLHRALREAPQDASVVSQVVFDLADAALSAAVRARGASATPSRRERTRADDRDRVEAAKALFAHRFRQPVGLRDAAAAAGCSAYHLSRVFRREVGCGLHSYLSRLRLRAAIDALLERREDLTTAALDAGFYDHAHFTNAFSRTFGFPPKALRRASARGLLSALPRATD